MMAIHVIAFNCLLHNPEAFTEQSVKNNSTDALRTHPTKQAVNQYLIDSILQKRRTVQRTENLWDRSLYNAATDTPPKQRETTRHHRLDNEEEDESTPAHPAPQAHRRDMFRASQTLTSRRHHPQRARQRNVPG